MEGAAALVIAIATLITSLGAVIIGMKNASRIQDVHVSINSRMDQLLKATGEAERAVGVTQERNRKVEET